MATNSSWSITILILLCNIFCCLHYSFAVIDEDSQLGDKFRETGGRRSKGSAFKLAAHPDCAADVDRLCGKITGQNNFAVIDCLQSDIKDNEVSESCQHLVWNYKKNLTTDYRFDSAVSELCGTVLEKMPQCNGLEKGKGMIIPCMIENIENITSQNCKAFLKRMETIVFSDFRLVYKFSERCQADIDRLQCGRLGQSDGDKSIPHNQGKTLTCLSEKLNELTPDCKHEILRVAELQADDYHSDRQLFYSCREDRENFCAKVRSGEGRVYKCLFRHKFDKEMSDPCRKMLTLRQQLQQEDYKVNIRLAKSCQTDILDNHCLRQIERVAGFKNARLSAILLCLEGAMKDGHEVHPECIVELKEVRRSLMEDYQINPLLVRDCSTEIQFHCGGGLHRDGKTIHCLMDLARPKKKYDGKHSPMSPTCVRALEEVLMEADVGDNYAMDPAIQEACEPIVRVLCKDVSPGEGRVMTCLMNSLNKPMMTEECKESLMEIYYFITRDFRLDSRLYKFCRSDARELCQAPKNWHIQAEDDDKEAYTPQMGYLVFACLYRHVHPFTSDPGYKGLTRPCAFEVKRVMRERAVTVDLDPEIESGCLTDLAKLCSDKTQKSEEIECLEDHLEDLSQPCRKAINDYAMAVGEDPEIDEIFASSCAPFWDKYCPVNMKEANAKSSDNSKDSKEKVKLDEIQDDLMTCLIKYKHHPMMSGKCRAGIEHQQLISLKDFRFSHNFKQACQQDILDYCESKVFDKTKVIKCLSETVRNDTLLDREHRVTSLCRQQLKFEFLQRSEDIKLDPELDQVCSGDVDLYCGHVTHGNAAVIECLREHQKRLSDGCHALLFKREEEEAKDPMTDFMLVSKCKSMIKKFCVDEMFSPEAIFGCLQRNKDDDDFDAVCFKAVIKREELRATDIRLNPVLEKNCAADVKHFCQDELNERSSSVESEGKVLLCLRKVFAKNSKKESERLTELCEEHVKIVIRESAQDYKQDVPLVGACGSEIKKYCSDHMGMDGLVRDQGGVEYCLRMMVEKEAITMLSNAECYRQIVRLLEESLADIQADVRLFKACSVDLKQHCGDVPKGQGRKMACLINIFNGQKIPLDDNCNTTLASRLKLWQKVAVESPDSLQKIAQVVVASPSRNYFIGVLIIVIGIIFITGMFCGRITKRLRRDLKDR